MQIIVATGRVGKDAELRTLPNSDTKVSNFSLAVESSRKGNDGKPDTTWFSVAIFGKLASAVSQYITKGKMLMVSGEVSARAWESNGKKGVDLRINADKVKLLGGGSGESKPKPADDDWLNGDDEPF